MILLSLSLRGAIGIREGLGVDEINIGFSAIGSGLLAFVAPNGYGKTTVLENLHPFRKLVSRDGKLADHFYLRDSHRILEWEQGGHTYRAKLLLDGVKGAAESYLYRDGEPLNDGKNTTYDAAIAEVVGDDRLFFRSLFRAQGAESVAAMTAGERKRMLSSLLGLDHYAVWHETIKDRIKDQEQKIAVLDKEIAVTGERVSACEAAVAEIAEHNERIAALRLDLAAVPENDIETIQRELGNSNAKVAALEGRVAELAAMIARFGTDDDVDTLLRQHNELVSDLRDLVARRERLEKIVANKSTIKAGLARIEELRGLITTEHESQAAHVAAKDGLTKIVERCRAEAQAAATEADRYERVWEQSIRVTGAISDELVFEDARHNEIIQRIANASEQLGGVPCHGMDIQSGCPLMRGAVELVSSAGAEDERWNEWLLDWKKRSEEAEAVREASAKEADDAAKRADEIDSKTEAEISQYELSNMAALAWSPFELARLTEALGVEEGKRWQTLDTECAGAVAAIGELDESITRAERAAQAKHGEYLDAIQARAAESARLNSEHALAVAALSDSKRNYEQISDQYTVAKSDVARRQSIEAQIAALTGVVIAAMTRRSGMEDSEQRLAELDAELSRVRADVNEWTMLARACSQNGIPALELDAAGPRISDIANDLLADTYGSEFRIEFETTRLTQSGDQTEAFEIMVYSGDDPRKIELLSGGQRVWIEAALSQAIALYIREQSGLDLRTSFLDEADGALDSDNAFRYLGMLRASHNRSGAHHTIIITHRQELLSLIPSQLHLVRGEGVAVI